MLKVSFQGNILVDGDTKCNRWYFKFNGNECSGPMTDNASMAVFILMTYYPSGQTSANISCSTSGYASQV